MSYLKEEIEQEIFEAINTEQHFDLDILDGMKNPNDDFDFENVELSTEEKEMMAEFYGLNNDSEFENVALEEHNQTKIKVAQRIKTNRIKGN